MNEWTREEAMQDLAENYSKPGTDITFQGPLKIYKKYDGVIPYEQIKQFLAESNTYTLFRENRKRAKQYNPYIVYAARSVLESDLVDMYESLKLYNDDFRYIVTYIDVFTKAVWCRGIKTKDGDTMVKTFNELYEDIRQRGEVKKLVTDLGKEFVGKKYKDNLSSKGIKLVHPQTLLKGPHCERFQRWLQTALNKYMLQNSTKRWVDALDDVVFTYMNSHHRSIDMSPREAEDPGNHWILADRLERRLAKIPIARARYKQFQFVRISTEPSKFKRSYNIQAIKEVFQIADVLTDGYKIPLYLLKELGPSGELLVGKWYGHELIPVSSSMTFSVKKVLKRGATHSLVNFEHLNNTVTLQVPNDTIAKENFHKPLEQFVQNK